MVQQNMSSRDCHVCISVLQRYAPIDSIDKTTSMDKIGQDSNVVCLSGNLRVGQWIDGIDVTRKLPMQTDDVDVYFEAHQLIEMVNANRAVQADHCRHLGRIQQIPLRENNPRSLGMDNRIRSNVISERRESGTTSVPEHGQQIFSNIRTARGHSRCALLKYPSSNRRNVRLHTRYSQPSSLEVVFKNGAE